MTVCIGKSASCLILVVEDEPETRETILEVLREEAYEAVGAEDGKNALEILGRGLRPDLVLLDLQMPVMDGWQFLEERGRDPGLSGIRVIVVSASPVDETPPGTDGFLSKPAHPTALLGAVSQVLGSMAVAGTAH